MSDRGNSDLLMGRGRQYKFMKNPQPDCTIVDETMNNLKTAQQVRDLIHARLLKARDKELHDIAVLIDKALAGSPSETGGVFYDGQLMNETICVLKGKGYNLENVGNQKDGPGWAIQW